MQQLIKDNIVVVKPSIGYRDIDKVVIDRQKVLDEWGVEPHRLPEIWSLMGDKGDNVKGVPGIGPKKAIKLIAEYGDLESVLLSDNPKIIDYVDTVRKAEKLIRLSFDAELTPVSESEMKFEPVEYDGEGSKNLEDLYDMLGFNNFKDRWKNNLLWNKTKHFGRKVG